MSSKRVTNNSSVLNLEEQSQLLSHVIEEGASAIQVVEKPKKRKAKTDKVTSSQSKAKDRALDGLGPSVADVTRRAGSDSAKLQDMGGVAKQPQAGSRAQKGGLGNLRSDAQSEDFIDDVTSEEAGAEVNKADEGPEELMSSLAQQQQQWLWLQQQQFKKQ